MDYTIVSLADAKARLSELADLAATGETVIITKRGKPVVRLTKPETPPVPVDLAELRRLTDGMPAQSEDAGSFMQRLRNEARY
jgi:antitoxin (DNA-binding transcriptional repressor) of toxin-antitoxin stability system